MEAVWKKIKSAIKGRIPNHSFEMWIEPLELKKEASDDWIVSCPNFFSKKRVSDLYGKLINTELKKEIGDACNLSFAVGGKSKPVRSSNNLQNHQLPLPNDSIRPHSGR
jgi:chromosomal replication initiator protein